MPCSIIFADSIFRGLQHARKYIPRCNLSSRIYGDLGVLNVRRERHGSDLPLQFQRHIYQSVWSVEEGKILVCKREMSNPLDSYAVIVIKGEQTVGHLPRKISRLCALSWKRRFHHSNCHGKKATFGRSSSRRTRNRLTLVRSVCWRLVQGPVHWRSYLPKRGGCLSTPCTLSLHAMGVADTVEGILAIAELTRGVCLSTLVTGALPAPGCR